MNHRATVGQKSPLRNMYLCGLLPCCGTKEGPEMKGGPWERLSALTGASLQTYEYLKRGS